MGKSQRDKGHNWEREVAKRLRDHGMDARRNIMETQLGNTGDVHIFNNEGEMIACVQCKNMKSPSVWKAMNEAVIASNIHSRIGEEPVPVSVVKRTAKPGQPVEEYAVMRFEDFCNFIIAYKIGEPIRKVMDMGLLELESSEMN
jgi:hypothetical protein